MANYWTPESPLTKKQLTSQLDSMMLSRMLSYSVSLSLNPERDDEYLPHMDFVDFYTERLHNLILVADARSEARQKGSGDREIAWVSETRRASIGASRKQYKTLNLHQTSPFTSQYEDDQRQLFRDVQDMIEGVDSRGYKTRSGIYYAAGVAMKSIFIPTQKKIVPVVQY